MLTPSASSAVRSDKAVILSSYGNEKSIALIMFFFRTQKGIPITDPSFYASISRETFTQLFYSDSPYEMPMIDERVKVLQEAGTVLMEVSIFMVKILHFWLFTC